MAHRVGAPYTRALGNEPEMSEFHKLMDKIAYSRSHWEVFIDFLQMTTCAMISENVKECAREKQYLEITQRYHKEDLQMFSGLLGQAMKFMSRTNRECLSELWEVYAANAKLGQFFTPWHVCEFMAKISVSSIDWSKYSPARKCWINDCACGGGRLLLAAAKQVPGINANSVAFHGVDTDPNVCMVAALNLLFFNLNGVIVNGNALTMEGHRIYKIARSYAGAEITESTEPEEIRFWIERGFKRIGTGGKTEPQKKELSTGIGILENEQLEFNF